MNFIVCRRADDEDDAMSLDATRFDIPYGHYYRFDPFVGLSHLIRILMYCICMYRFIVCAFVLAVALMWPVLTVFTIVSSSPHLRLHWLFYFVNKGFVRGTQSGLLRRSRAEFPFICQFQS